MLVSTEWVSEHLSDPKVRIVESNEDRALYTQGHVPGAVEIDWQVDLQDQVQEDAAASAVAATCSVVWRGVVRCGMS